MGRTGKGQCRGAPLGRMPTLWGGASIASGYTLSALAGAEPRHPLPLKGSKIAIQRKAFSHRICGTVNKKAMLILCQFTGNLLAVSHIMQAKKYPLKGLKYTQRMVLGPLESLAAGMTLTGENSYRPATHCIKAAPKKSRGNSLPAADRIGNLIIVTTPTSQHHTVQIGIRDVPGSVRQSPLKGAGLWRSIVQRYPHRQGYAQIKIVLQFLLSKSDKGNYLEVFVLLHQPNISGIDNGSLEAIPTLDAGRISGIGLTGIRPQTVAARIGKVLFRKIILSQFDLIDWTARPLQQHGKTGDLTAVRKLWILINEKKLALIIRGNW